MDGIPIFFTFVIFANISGYITRQIIKNKGYKENWYWWGFFFGIPAIMVALIKPEAPIEYAPDRPRRDIQKAATMPGLQDDKEFAFWNCICGRQNASYTNTCACSRTREEAAEQIRKRFEYAQAKKLEQSKGSSPPLRARTEELQHARSELARELIVIKKNLEDVDAAPEAVAAPDMSTPVWERMDSALVPETPVQAEPVITPSAPVQEEPVITPSAPPKPEPVITLKEPPKPMLTQSEIGLLMQQAKQLETAGEIYSLLRGQRDRIKTQEFDSLLQELRNCADVERVYGNSKDTAIIHLDLYNGNSSTQTASPQYML